MCGLASIYFLHNFPNLITSQYHDFFIIYMGMEIYFPVIYTSTTKLDYSPFEEGSLMYYCLIDAQNVRISIFFNHILFGIPYTTLAYVSQDSINS